MEKPIRKIAASVPTMAIGTVTVGISVARQERKNTEHDQHDERRRGRRAVRSTSRTALPTKTRSSERHHT